MPGPHAEASPAPLPPLARATLGGIAAVGTNLATAQAGAAIGGTNGIASGTGWEIQGIAAFLNLAAQYAKMHRRFDQDRWTIPLLIILGIALAYLVWLDVGRAILNGAIAAWQANANYKTLNATGIQILAPATPYEGDRFYGDDRGSPGTRG